MNMSHRPAGRAALRALAAGITLVAGLAIAPAASLAQSGPNLPPPGPSPMDQTGVRTAGDLLQTCRHGARPDDLSPEDASKARVCKAYMVAFFQNEVANPPIDAGSRLCLVGDISFNRMAEMLRDYGDVRTELNGAPADQLMRASLQANYPCPQQPGN